MPTLRRALSNPTFSLIVSLEASILVAIVVVFIVAPDRRFFYWYYHAPIAAPFAAFLFDRARRFHETPLYLWPLELLVVGFAAARAFYNVPVISGHALFLSYSLLTSRSKAARWLAGMVLAEVFMIKVFVWHDPTIYGGAAVAAACAGLYWLGMKTQRSCNAQAT